MTRDDNGTSLALMSRAAKMLAEADTLQKAKELKNLALTAADWARRKGLGEEAVQHARAYAMRAERRIGELLKATERAKPAVGSKVIGTKRVPMKDTTPTLADLGISKRESAKAQRMAELPAEEFESVVVGKTTRKAAEKKTAKRKAESRMADAQAKVSAEAKTELSKVCEIRHCSMQELLSDKGVKPDCIITDPPYPEDFLPLYGVLAKLAKKIPLVAVMCGQSYLPKIYAAMSEHLTYRWTLAYMTPGGQSVQQWKAKVNTFWKPVLLFGSVSKWIGDVCQSNVNDNDKRFHGWGQSESGMGDLVQRLSEPNELVCDPFVGGGTTALVCLRLGRRFIGCDADKAAVKTSTQRCELEVHERLPL